jgi:hypothetical protein
MISSNLFFFCPAVIPHPHHPDIATNSMIGWEDTVRTGRSLRRQAVTFKGLLGFAIRPFLPMQFG